MRLKGKRAVITGAASGIGYGACLLFADEGASVVGIDVDRSGLEALGNASSARVRIVQADLARGADVRRAMAEAIGQLGGLDILWNHAGVFPQPAGGRIDGEEFDDVMEINVKSGILATREALPVLSSQGCGSIIFTSSSSGLVGSPSSEIYSATKFAIVGLVKSLALRYARQNIRVNAICPGPIDTPMQTRCLAGSDARETAENYARVAAGVPLGRIGRVAEVAEAGLWLASDASSFVTGIALPVDGGVTAR